MADVSSEKAKSRQWSEKEFELARQAKTLNALKLEAHIRKIQRVSGRSRRECMALVLRNLPEKLARRPWTESEIDQVRELLVMYSVKAVAERVGRSSSSIKGLCNRLQLHAREIRCDLMSIESLAALMRVRKTEIRHWLEQGWLKTTASSSPGEKECRISPEALQHCLRVHRADLQKRRVLSTTILNVYTDYCHVPKHTLDEQLLKVREAKQMDEDAQSACRI